MQLDKKQWMAGCNVPSIPTMAKTASPRTISIMLLRVSRRSASSCGAFADGQASRGVNQNRLTAANSQHRCEHNDLEHQQTPVFR